MADAADIYKIEQLLFDAVHALDGIASLASTVSDGDEPWHLKFQQLSERAAMAKCKLELSGETLTPEFQFAQSCLQNEPDEDPAMY